MLHLSNYSTCCLTREGLRGDNLIKDILQVTLKYQIYSEAHPLYSLWEVAAIDRAKVDHQYLQPHLQKS